MEQKTYDKIINNSMYTGFKYATVVSWEGGVSGRRLRGHEIDLLYKYLGQDFISKKDDELNKALKELEEATERI